jgi:transposase
VQRAKILLTYAHGKDISFIKKGFNVSRPTIYKCIDKALASGIERGLKNKYHRPKNPIIKEEAKAWVVNLACTKLKDHGYALEVWTLSSLAKHARKHAPVAGHACLKRAAKATIQRILKSQPLQPHKVRHYLDRRDEEFENMMHYVLVVFKKHLKSIITMNRAKKSLPCQWMKNRVFKHSRIPHRTYLQYLVNMLKWAETMSIRDLESCHF